MLIVGICSFVVGAFIASITISACSGEVYDRGFADGFKAGMACVRRHLRPVLWATIEQSIQRDKEWLRWGQKTIDN